MKIYGSYQLKSIFYLFNLRNTILLCKRSCHENCTFYDAKEENWNDLSGIGRLTGMIL